MDGESIAETMRTPFQSDVNQITECAEILSSRKNRSQNKCNDF